MVNVDASQRIGGERRAKQIIRLKIPNCFPQRRQQVSGYLQTRLARDLAVRVTQWFELITADFCGGQLLLQADSAGFFPRLKMMPCLAIGAHDHFGAEAAAEFALPHLERARGGEFVIIEMSVDRQDIHSLRRHPIIIAR